MCGDADSELVSRAQKGDEGAFTELFRRHSERVFRLALSVLGRGFEAEAEEIAQEVFLKVHHSLGLFRGQAKVSSWIYRITFNHAMNLKTRARYRRPHLDDGALSEKVSAEPNPHSQLETAQRDRALAACIESLPDVYQSALRLHYWLGASVAEAADLLDVPENTIKSYLYRARQLLDSMLKERGYNHV
jgi:RNA polymerase sigma-70 factor (ECF subfamily)